MKAYRLARFCQFVWCVYILGTNTGTWRNWSLESLDHTLSDDDGVVIDQWYLADGEATPKQAVANIENALPVYLNREEYIALALDFGKTAEQHLRSHDSRDVDTRQRNMLGSQEP